MKIERAFFKRKLISGLSPAMRWALLSCLILAFTFGVAGFVLIFGYDGFLPMLIASIIFLAAFLVLAALAALLLAALKKLRWQTVFVFAFSSLLCLSAMNAMLYIVPLLVSTMVAVYLAVMHATGQYAALRKPKKILRCSLLGFFSALTVTGLIIILYPGPAFVDSLRPGQASLALPYQSIQQSDTAPVLSDPSLPGNYSYSVFYYAAPGQKIDPYPEKEALPSTTTNATGFVDGWSDVRELMLGFGPDALPLNAQIWMPDGDGSFPLALIVHGNHAAADRSDAGYAYLGELLASRGIIAASIDQNFLNDSMLYDILIFSMLQEEIDARAFVLLEHLQKWFGWNADPSHPFFEKVDFNNIALIGHSRGGEAAALAAAFAELDFYPDNGIVRLDYPFRIKTVIALAPVDNTYDPAELELSLKDVNYLALHGSHDTDVYSFMGANMFGRTDVSGDGVKALVWIQYANHGQFNSSWGKTDLPGLMHLMANRNYFISIDEQQQAAKVFISAFLESTLLGNEGYNALFRDFAYGADWLPRTLYITDYADDSMILLDSFDKTFDIETSSSNLAAYSARGFDLWTQSELPGKMVNSDRVLTLSWGNKDYVDEHDERTPVFRTEFVEGAVTIGDKLFISLCSGDGETNPDITFQIKLTDSSGGSAVMSIDDFGGVVDPIDAPAFKPIFSLIRGEREPVLQMVCIPTELFEGLSGSVDSMEWVMPAGSVGEEGATLYADDLRVQPGETP